MNYNPETLPRSQDAMPIIQESTGLYGIKSNILKKKKCRIGVRPFFYQISENESLDLDTEDDFRYLEYYVKRYLPSTNNK